METSIHALQDHIKLLRDRIKMATDDTNISPERHAEIVEGCKNNMYLKGYNDDLLFMQNETFEDTFIKAQTDIQILDNYKL